MKVLFVLNHAPDYRESFLRELGRKVNLTVIAQPCKVGSLHPPVSRMNYTYIEWTLYINIGFNLGFDVFRKINFTRFDIICCNFNPRQIHWVIYFLSHPKLWNRWIWWGKIFSGNKCYAISLIRSIVLKMSAGALVYSQPIANKIKAMMNIAVTSFNNTDVNRDDFRIPYFSDHFGLRLLFIGRYQERKKIERLVELSLRNEWIFVKVVGSGMDKLSVPKKLKDDGRFIKYSRTFGQNLLEIVDWCDIFISPGNVGLLAMNAARFGKGIVVDADSDHAPEYWLAKEANQPFIPFHDQDRTDSFFLYVKQNKHLLKYWGTELQKVCKEKYTVEMMADIHYKFFKYCLKN